MSLDRINNSLGYVIGNVQFVSIVINFMKNTMSEKEVYELINIIKKS
jgi:hypothetical protein